MNERRESVRQMLKQLKSLWSNVEASLTRYDWIRPSAGGERIYNNSKWFDELSMLEIMRVMAPGMKIGAMLGRES